MPVNRTMRQIYVLMGIGLGCCLLLARPAHADTIRSPVSATTDAGEDTPLQRAIDGSGLTQTFVSGTTDFDAYIALNPRHTVAGLQEWFSTEGVNAGNIFFDLGDVYTINRVALWNEEAAGLSNIDVFSCPDAICSSATAIGNFVPSNNPSSIDYPAEVFSVTSTATRYIRLSVTGPQLDSIYNGLALGEIAFATSSAATIPEPTTMLLLGTGLAGIGGMIRKRRQVRSER